MDLKALYRKYYTYNSQALNTPNQFLDSVKKTRRLQLIPDIAISLLEIKARIVLGELRKAKQLLKVVTPLIDQSQDHFYHGQMYLVENMLLSATSTALEQNIENLNLAEQSQKQCGSKALECEIIIARVQTNPVEMEITTCEDSLKLAMRLAMDADLPDLMIAVHLAYIQVYQSHQLPNLADREMQLLALLIDKDTHIYRNIQMLIQKAVNKMMLKEYESAEATLTAALDLANKNGFKLLSSSIYHNLAICQMRMTHYDRSIQLSDTGLEILRAIDCQNSMLAAKITSSKANCLAFMGDIQKSAATIRTIIESFRGAGNTIQEHIHSVNLADVLIEIQQFDEAQQLLDAAIEYFTNTANHGYLQSAQLCKARFYEVQLKYQEAFSSMEELYCTSRKYFNENFAKQTQRFQQRIEELRTEYQLLKSRCADREVCRGQRVTDRLLGDHPLIKKALSEALLAARHPYANVIIHGESGTGKEVLARIIHFADTADKPLVAINAAAIAPSLIESELFGHVKGAFTGAVSDYKGKFLMANGGTLFLDEISEMPLEVQAKLLRAIENQIITPVGSNKEYSVRCRIICATNVKLNSLIRSNKFRLDLYHRLNKVEIYLPALRERISDLEILTRQFVYDVAQEQGLPVPEISGSFYERLARYSFPGNIRELKNIIERIFILKYRQYWEAEQLEGMLLDEHDHKHDSDAPMTENLDKMEYNLILNALDKSNWVQKEAARLLEISESTLTRHMQKLGINRSKRQ
ncbi:MAG TPA: sigma-54 dependent transcriptional regulator [Candidatus Cloacimonadota bacterium]|nr:sigma-54 dependent transcriptional regulator [Candidatus Cloacimonadota bacterium]